MGYKMHKYFLLKNIEEQALICQRMIDHSTYEKNNKNFKKGEKILLMLLSPILMFQIKEIEVDSLLKQPLKK